MKKLTALFLLASILLTFTSCFRNLTDKSDIISLFQKNEETFIKAVQSADYSDVERISGVQKVDISAAYVDIQCGGAGLGSSTHYYGIFYSADDDLCAIDVAGPKDELVEDDDGYLFSEDSGDNRYYVEPLGNHFFYYEAHF